MESRNWFLSVADMLDFVLVFVFVAVLIYGFGVQFSVAATLKGDQSLRNWETLSSPSGVFVLGFFRHQTSDNYFLGIRYKNDIQGVYFIGKDVPWANGDEPAVVWIANRDNPTTGTSGVFSIEKNGTLWISGGEDSPLLIYAGNADADVTLSLLDSGNLVLTEGNSSDGRRLWQSFDYPTHVLLPGMRLRANRPLTAWLSTEVPARGAFALGVDPGGEQELIMWERGDIYWRSGDWNGTSFGLVPSITSNNLFDLMFDRENGENYFSFTVKNSSVTSWWVLQLSGQIWQPIWPEEATWRNGFQVEPFVACEGQGSDRSMGCVRRINSSFLCPAEGDGFSVNRRSVAGQAPFQALRNSSLALSDCKGLCKRNCSCIAYASAYENGTGCYLYEGKLALEQYTGLRDIYTRGSALGSTEGRRFPLWIIAVTVIPVVVLLSSFVFFYLWKRKHRRRREEMLLFELGTNVDDEARGENTGSELPIFSFASIVAATDGFSSANLLGKGGFGFVYKGKLKEGQDIAVKRLSRSSGQGLEEFKNEITLIAKLQHTNLVRLFGCCIQGAEKMLIYEYLPNKSLDFFLFDPNNKKQLDWPKRVHIIQGIAQGLLYLHKYSRLRIIHRDLKPSNILLDSELNPKISDFGMARIFSRCESEATTNRVVGTYGYMSPEYAMGGLFSEKSDVFSFGVLLLEILSGKRNTSFHDSNVSTNLIGCAWEMWKEGEVLQLVDPILTNASMKEDLSRYVQLALLCVQDNAADRPTMFDVVSLLSNETVPLAAPNRPAFTLRPLTEGDVLRSKHESFSVNDCTASTVEAR